MHINKESATITIVAFLLMTPQLSIPLLGILRIDSYTILLLLLAARHFFLRKKIARPYISRLELTWILVLGSITFSLISQCIANESYGVQAHLTGIAGREDINLTFGYIYSPDRSILSIFNLRFFAIIALGFYISHFLKTLPIKSRLIFLQRSVYICAGFQLFYLILYISGLHIIFGDIFFESRIGDQFSDRTASRLGLLRLPGGFSEPSFMAVVLFAIVGCLLIQTSQQNIELSIKERFILLAYLLFISATTISFTNFFVTLFFATFLVFPTRFRAKLFISAVLCASITFFLQIFSFLAISKMIPDELYSIAVRQLFITPPSDLSATTWLLGYAIGQAFNFPIVNNFALQLGILGTTFLLIAFLFNKRQGLISFCYFSLIISVAPNFSCSYIYVALGLFFGVQSAFWGKKNCSQHKSHPQLSRYQIPRESFILKYSAKRFP